MTQDRSSKSSERSAVSSGREKHTLTTIRSQENLDKFGSHKKRGGSHDDLDKSILNLRNSRSNLDSTLNLVPDKFKKVAKAIITSTPFDIFMGLVIIANSASIGAELSIKQSGGDVTIFLFIEHIYLCIYLGDVCLRVIVFGSECLNDIWTRFDVFLTFIGIFIAWILWPIMGSLTYEWRALFMCRALRLLRLARMVRHLSAFKSMWTLVSGLLSSAGTIIWTFVIMAVLLYVWACVGMEIIANHRFASGPLQDPEFAAAVDRDFTNIPTIMLTLVQFIFCDGIGEVYNPLIRKDWRLTAYFVTFLFVVSIALMNLVTGVIVEGAIERANADREMMAAAQKRRKRKILGDLQVMFEKLDEDDSGFLSQDELLGASPEMKDELMKLLDMDTFNDAVHLIKSVLEIDTEEGVSIEEFMAGMLKLITSKAPVEVLEIQKMVLVLQTDLRRWCDNMAFFSTDTNAPRPAFGRTRSTNSAYSSLSQPMAHVRSINSAVSGQQNRFGRRLSREGQSRGSFSSADDDNGISSTGQLRATAASSTLQPEVGQIGSPVSPTSGRPLSITAPALDSLADEIESRVAKQLVEHLGRSHRALTEQIRTLLECNKQGTSKPEPVSNLQEEETVKKLMSNLKKCEEKLNKCEEELSLKAREADELTEELASVKSQRDALANQKGRRSGYSSQKPPSHRGPSFHQDGTASESHRRLPDPSAASTTPPGAKVQKHPGTEHPFPNVTSKVVGTVIPSSSSHQSLGRSGTGEISLASTEKGLPSLSQGQDHGNSNTSDIRQRLPSDDSGGTIPRLARPPPLSIPAKNDKQPVGFFKMDAGDTPRPKKPVQSSTPVVSHTTTKTPWEKQEDDTPSQKRRPSFIDIDSPPLSVPAKNDKQPVGFFKMDAGDTPRPKKPVQSTSTPVVSQTTTKTPWEKWEDDTPSQKQPWEDSD